MGLEMADNLEIHEAQRAGSSLAQAARPGYGCDGMSAACRAALRFNSLCISPALQAGGIFVFRFPRALPWAKASRAFGAGSWSQLTSERETVHVTLFPQRGEGRGEG